MQTNLALKEWAVVVAALDRGEQILLIRKGGIAEKHFDIKSRNFLLYPTFFHEMEKLVDGRYHLLLERASVGASSKTVTIANWAALDDVIATRDMEGLLTVSEHYVYTPSYVKDRFDWRADMPVNLLFVKVFRLHEPAKLSVNSRYRGCKSWVELDEVLDLEGSTPVVSENEFQARKKAIKSELSASALV